MMKAKIVFFLNFVFILFFNFFPIQANAADFSSEYKTIDGYMSVDDSQTPFQELSNVPACWSLETFNLEPTSILIRDPQPILLAPPGGGDPISGLTPVHGGLVIMIGLIVIYFLFIYFRQSNKMKKLVVSLFLLMFLGSSLHTNAQTGTFRSVYKEDFGTTNHILPVGMTSNYSFVTGQDLDGGQYNILKSISSASFPVWTKALTDHTTGSGCMMVVNASKKTTDIVFRNTFSVCPNTQMYFRLWVANLIQKGSSNQYDPTLKVTIQNTPGTTPFYQEFTTRTIVRDNSKWHAYPNSSAAGVIPLATDTLGLHLPMTASDNTSLIVTIYDVTTGSPDATDGNDFAIDDIEFYAHVPTVIANGAGDYCLNGNLNLSTTINQYGNIYNGEITAQWQFSSDGGSTWSNVSGITSTASYAYTGPSVAGQYRVVIGPTGFDSNCSTCTSCSVYSAPITITLGGFTTLYWSKTPVDQNWNNVSNWTLSDGVTPAPHAPTSCDDVHIPGNSDLYPSLASNISGSSSVCHDIWFHFGGEIAKPQHLEYHYAYVQYNFGYYDGSDFKEDADAFSATPMKRGKWYALAAPLQKISTADFSVGGFPNMWQKSFKTSPNQNGATGLWYNPSNRNWNIADQYNAVAIWGGEYLPGVLGEDNHAHLNSLQGILEMPYFENSATSTLHRIHSYKNDTSIFGYYYYTTPNLPIIDPILYASDSLARKTEAYRFVFEGSSFTKSQVDGKDVYTMSVKAGDEIMIGNPFLSSLDFDQFIALNPGITSYRLYSENSFNTYSYTAGAGGALQYIAPLQAFFITPSTTEIKFCPEDMTTTVSSNKLKSSKNPNWRDDVIYVKAQSKEGTSWLTFSMQDVQEKNIGLLLDNYPNVPQLYSKDQIGKKNVVQFEGGYVKEAPVGLLCGSKDSVLLTVYNAESLAVDGLILKDNLLKKDVNLMAQTTYSFINEPELADRFTIVFGNKVMTNIGNIENENVVISAADGETVYVKSFLGNPIHTITVYSVKGQLLYQETNVGSSNRQISLLKNDQVVIVKVDTERGSKVQKLRLKK